MIHGVIRGSTNFDPVPGFGEDSLSDAYERPFTFDPAELSSKYNHATQFVKKHFWSGFKLFEH